MATKSCDYESSRDSHSEDGSEHFFVPLSASGAPSLGAEQRGFVGRTDRLFASEAESFLGNSILDNCGGKKFDESDTFNECDSLSEYDRVNGFLSSAACSNYAASESQTSFYDLDDTPDQVFSPPLLMETSLLADSYEDLLGKYDRSFLHVPLSMCSLVLALYVHVSMKAFCLPRLFEIQYGL